jgi:hypothetical protein
MDISKGKSNFFLAYLNGAIALLYFVVVVLILFGLLDLEYFKGVDLTIMMLVSMFFGIASICSFKGLSVSKFLSDKSHKTTK